MANSTVRRQQVYILLKKNFLTFSPTPIEWNIMDLISQRDNMGCVRLTWSVTLVRGNHVGGHKK